MQTLLPGGIEQKTVTLIETRKSYCSPIERCNSSKSLRPYTEGLLKTKGTHVYFWFFLHCESPSYAARAHITRLRDSKGEWECITCRSDNTRIIASDSDDVSRFNNAKQIYGIQKRYIHKHSLPEAVPAATQSSDGWNLATEGTAVMPSPPSCASCCPFPV